MATSDWTIAHNRFGLGFRPGDTATGTPRAWLNAQRASFIVRPQIIASLPPRSDLVDAIGELRSLGQQKRRDQNPAQGEAMAQMQPGGAMVDPAEDPALPEWARGYLRKAIREHYLVQARARFATALASTAPFAERLTHFWANHFAVSVDKLPVIGLAGLMEFEAVRPHVFGRFADMLGAVERHPAMLLYLDQAQSIGPDSAIGSRIANRGGRQAGLNENLAREILELHTLGVRSGYSQNDVTEFARALTGFTVAGMGRPALRRLAGTQGTPGDFAFADPLHEPGPRTIMGKSFAQTGQAQADAVLAMLAVHPATARHLSAKLARHFVSDTPPPRLVGALEADWLRTGGDLASWYNVLIDGPEAWAPAQAKFKTPWEWTVSAARAAGVVTAPQPQALAGLMQQLGQPIWKPGSPAGYDDIAASWMGPDALLRRVEVAPRLMALSPALPDARALAPVVLGTTLRPDTATAIARAESPAQAMALLTLAPEFMRR